MKNNTDKIQTPFWYSESPYYSYSVYTKNTFGERIQKLSVNAGLTCPNRDGAKGRGGCIYCSNDAFCPSYCTSDKDVVQQINEGIEFHAIRYRRVKRYLAYFQTYSNTYGDADFLIDLYNKALSHPLIAGLVIGTRPDCISGKIFDYLQSLTEKYLIFIEFGVESCYDETLIRVNRGHSFSDSLSAIHESRKRGLHTGIHLIFGLPGESREQMLKQAEIISELDIQSIKFHQLQIIKGTRLAEEYEKNPQFVNLFSFDEYVDFVISFLELLRPDIVVERLVAEVPPRFLVTGSFGIMRNDQIINAIVAEMRKRNTWQGKKWKGKDK